jgi:putative intracellular protease/amidase
MKAYVIIYDGFTEFETILANYFIKTKGEIVSVGIDDKMITSFEGFQIKPNMTIDAINLSDVDILIIPGGNPEEILKCKKLNEVLVELNRRKTLIASICSGTIHLAKASILDNKKYTSAFNFQEIAPISNGTLINCNVVRDENVITAKPNGYVDFAIEIGKALNIFEDENDLNETIENFKYFR